MIKTLKIFTNVISKSRILKEIIQHAFKSSNTDGFKNKYSSFNATHVKNVITYGYLTFIGLGSKTVPNRNNTDDIKKNSDWRREKDISRQITLAEGAIIRGDLKRAELILQQALLAHKDAKTAGVICIYDMLATLAYKDGNIERAKDILEKVIQYLGTSGIPKDSDDVVTFRLKLARILSKLGKTNEAETNFRKCLEMQLLKQQVGVRNEAVDNLRINCLFWYGKHLAKNKKFIEAKQCFDTAYTLSAKVKSIENDQVMVILYNLSEASLALGERETALRHLLNAVILGRRTNSPDLPTYYNKIGMIYLSKGVLREAKHWCESGRDRAKRLHNKTALEEGESCINRINEVLRLGPLKL